METLISTYQRLLSFTSLDFVREPMGRVNWENKLVAVRGARGVGKTTLLLQYIKSHYQAGDTSALYVSLDHLYFARHTLSEFVETFYQHGGKHLFLDEVHKYPSWSREIKSIYDSYPDLKVVFTGSSLINILNAEADLSRRCVSYDMQGLSYREYLSLFCGIQFPCYSFSDILEHGSAICHEVNARMRPLQHFDDYLQHGYYPFYRENSNYYMRISGISNLILDVELPQLCNVEVGNIRKIKTLLAIISSEVPLLVDTSKLAALSGFTRATLLSYLQYLYRAKLIQLVYADEDSVKKMQKPDKILLENPNLLYALSLNEVNVGTARETFFYNQVGYAHRVEYAKSGDFIVDKKYAIEIGGKSKGAKQIAKMPNAYIAADSIEYSMGNKIPLWLFGFLY